MNKYGPYACHTVSRERTESSLVFQSPELKWRHAEYANWKASIREGYPPETAYISHLFGSVKTLLWTNTRSWIQ